MALPDVADQLFPSNHQNILFTMIVDLSVEIYTGKELHSALTFIIKKTKQIDKRYLLINNFLTY